MCKYVIYFADRFITFAKSNLSQKKIEYSYIGIKYGIIHFKAHFINYLKVKFCFLQFLLKSLCMMGKCLKSYKEVNTFILE